MSRPNFDSDLQIPHHDGENSSLPIPIGESKSNLPIRSWTRLGLGIVLLGLDALTERTRTWESNVEQSHQTVSKPLHEHISPTIIGQDDLFSPAEPDISHQYRQAVVGLFFDIQERFFRGIKSVRRVEKLTDQLILPAASPIVNARLFRPVKKVFEKLVSRGQSQVDVWIQIGMKEEKHSRELLKTATITTVDTSIDYLSTNPDVKELVQSQSTSLINEIIEEIRERTVSGDTLVEGIVRAVFRLTPRQNLPEPPLEVRMRAVRIRPPKIDKFIEDKP